MNTRTHSTASTRVLSRQFMGLLLAGAVLALAWALPAAAMSNAQLADTVAQRIHGSRTGVCVAAAVIDHGEVSNAYVCADGDQTPRIGPESAFEIGSVTKTMTAALLAELINQGKASLDDPLAAWLPEGTEVPEWHGQPIRLKDIVTHSSGLPALPPGVAITNPRDPYAAMSPEQVIAALGNVSLPGAPGTQPTYSNFAMMLLSWGLAQRAGTAFETLLDQRLFQPLGMTGAYVAHKPEGIHAATGHTPNGQPTPAWHFPDNMAGVGGVRATLPAMVRYVRAQLDPDSDTAVGQAIALTHSEPDVPAPLARGINWFIRTVGGHTVYFHGGGTGGFSSLAAFAPDIQRGVVLLADTALTATGGLGDLGMHLIDADVPLHEPRTLATPSESLLQALAGEYTFPNGMAMTLSHDHGVLYIQVTGQPRFEMGYDSTGDFYPLKFNALLHPAKTPEGTWTFTWRQGGAALPATRRDAGSQPQYVELDAEVLDDYPGTYPLMPGFELTVKVSNGHLEARATGQSYFKLDALGDDHFEAAAYGIRIDFQRDEDGKVVSLQLHQGGHSMSGTKQ